MEHKEVENIKPPKTVDGALARTAYKLRKIRWLWVLVPYFFYMTWYQVYWITNNKKYLKFTYWYFAIALLILIFTASMDEPGSTGYNVITTAYWTTWLACLIQIICLRKNVREEINIVSSGYTRSKTKPASEPWSPGWVVELEQIDLALFEEDLLFISPGNQLEIVGIGHYKVNGEGFDRFYLSPLENRSFLNMLDVIFDETGNCTKARVYQELWRGKHKPEDRTKIGKGVLQKTYVHPGGSGYVRCWGNPHAKFTKVAFTETIRIPPPGMKGGIKHHHAALYKRFIGEEGTGIDEYVLISVIEGLFECEKMAMVGIDLPPSAITVTPKAP